MNLVLTRNEACKDGVFGDLADESGGPVAVTLEHAYLDDLGDYGPKIPPGTYACKRGMHKLSHGDPFETFEVMGVPGHTGLLFHPGNVNADSEGCILVGRERWHEMITKSREAFAAFMALQGDEKEFLLVIR